MADTPQQRASYREAVGYENQSDRYGLEGQFMDWKRKVSAIQSEMRDNQLALKKANRRYQQVQAAGGQGTYGTPELGRSINDLRTQIESSKSGISTSPVMTGYDLQSGAQLQSKDNDYGSRLQENATMLQLLNLKPDPNGTDRDNPLRSSPLLQSDRYKQLTNPNNFGRNYNATESINADTKKTSDDRAENAKVLEEQSRFEQEQKRQADAWNANISQQEQDFIQSLLNEPEPTTPSLRGLSTVKTPQQIDAERDQVINSSMQQQQKPQATNAKMSTYLAKNPRSLPLAGYNAANLRSASNRVQGALLGGSNSNKLT